MGRPKRTIESSVRVFGGVPPHLVELVLKWAEWRSVKASAKSPGLPDGEPRITSTAPRGPSYCEEINLCILRLDEDLRICISIMASHWREPWPKGVKWQSFLDLVELKPPEFERRLNLALKGLARTMRTRGLL